jgi:hypothetical protein
VPRNHDLLSETQRCRAVTDVDHFCDALVANRKRPDERRGAGDDRAIEVARRRRDRAHDGVAGFLHTRFRDFGPAQLPPTHVLESPHPAAR